MTRSSPTVPQLQPSESCLFDVAEKTLQQVIFWIGEILRQCANSLIVHHPVRYADCVGQGPLACTQNVWRPLGVEHHILQTCVPCRQESRDQSLFLRRFGDDSDGIQSPLPVLAVKHQEGDGEIAIRHMQRGDCIAAVRFLAAFEIEDFSVYGLSMTGPVASRVRRASWKWTTSDLAPASAVHLRRSHVCINILATRLHRGSSPWQLSVQSIVQGRHCAVAAFLGGMKGHEMELR